MRQIFTLMLAMVFVYGFAQRRESSVWYVERYNEAQARSYIDNNYYLDKIEGIWQSSDGFKYAIEKDVKNGQRIQNKFRIIILESSSNGWRPTEIKGFIDYGSINSVYSMKYYIKYEDGTGLSSENIFLSVENALIMSFQRLNGDKVTLYKLYPKAPEVQSTDQSQSRMNVEQWSGSCVAVSKRLVATNYHVVENAQNLVVCGVNGDKNTDYDAEVVLKDKINDLAIVKISDSRFIGFNIKYGIRNAVAEVGSDVFVLGYPLTTTMGEDIKLTTGVISSKTGFQGDVSQYQISAPIQPGNSGGPLFDNQGNLIGIVSAKHRGAENVGYAIKISYLKNLLDSSNDPISLQSTNTISSQSLPQKVKSISPCVLIIKANTKTVSSGGGVRKNDGITIQQEADKDVVAKAQALYESSRRKFQNGDYAGAYEDACKSIELYPTPTSHYVKGYLALFNNNEPDIAIGSIEYCLEHNYNVDACHDILAKCYYAKKDYDKCIVYINELITKDRKNISALAFRAHCKHLQKNDDAAMRDYSEAIKYDGIVDYDYADIYNSLAFYTMQKGDLVKAKEYIEKSFKHNHLYGNAWDTYGELNYKIGKYTECVECMNKSITIGKLLQSAHWMDNSYLYRGLAKKQLGDLVGAYKDLERAIELGDEIAPEELKKIDASTLDFSNDNSYSIITKQPKVKKSVPATEIRGVELTDEYTAIYFCYTNTKYDEGGWYSIDPNAYIRDKATGKKYVLVAAENCGINPRKTSIEKGETKNFTLYFAPISKNAVQIDFVESDKSEWRFYGIQIK